jgi:hypothetical protein
MIVSYNASVVKIYNDTSSLVYFENKNISSDVTLAKLQSNVQAIMSSYLKTSSLTISSLTISSLTISSLTASSLTISSLTISSLTASSLTISSLTISSLTASSLTISSPTISSLTASILTTSRLHYCTKHGYRNAFLRLPQVCATTLSSTFEPTVFGSRVRCFFQTEEMLPSFGENRDRCYDF